MEATNETGKNLADGQSRAGEAGANLTDVFATVDGLTALVRRLAHSLRQASPENNLPEKALGYLRRKGLQGSPLRKESNAKLSTGERRSNMRLGLQIDAHIRQLSQHMMQRDGVVLLREARDEIYRMNLELQKRDKCSFMGPMRDCPTHGESTELKSLRADNTRLQFALEQSEAKFLTPNVKLTSGAHDAPKPE